MKPNSYVCEAKKHKTIKYYFFNKQKTLNKGEDLSVGFSNKHLIRIIYLIGTGFYCFEKCFIC
jgi:hypothetical protein